MKYIIKKNPISMRCACSSKIWLCACCLFIAILPSIAAANISQGVDVARRQRLTAEQGLEIDILNGIVDTYARASKSAFEDGDYAVAERAARNGLAVVPNSMGLLRLQGESLIRMGLEREALRVYIQINKTMSDNNSFARIGLLLTRAGRYQESLNMAGMGLLESTLSRSLSSYAIRPNNRRNLEAYWLLTIGALAGQYANDEECIYYYSQAQEINHSHLLANYRLGKILLRKKQYESALEYLGNIRNGPEAVMREVGNMSRIAKARVGIKG